MWFVHIKENIHHVLYPRFHISHLGVPRPIFSGILIKRNHGSTVSVGAVIQAEQDAETSLGKNHMGRFDGNMKAGHLFHATREAIRGEELFDGEMRKKEKKGGGDILFISYME